MFEYEYRCLSLASLATLSDSKRSPTKLLIVIGGVVVVAIGAFIAWKASIVEYDATGQKSQTFTIECDFDRFRQIMVRKNSTAAIVSHSGMKLLNEQIQDVDLDTSKDDRPLLNAIRGKTKSELSAIRLLTVELNDPFLEANELHLRQVADIQPQQMDVKTASTGPAGKLQSYSTTLHAEPQAESTSVTISVDMQVRVKVPKLFTGRADAQVQQAAVDAIHGQQQAMTQFIAEHADERLILPELGDK